MKMANATRTQRLLAGFGVLLLVDVIWVASSEITKVHYNYHWEHLEEKYCTNYLLYSSG